MRRSLRTCSACTGFEPIIEPKPRRVAQEARLFVTCLLLNFGYYPRLRSCADGLRGSMSKVATLQQVAALVPGAAVVAVNSSSGLCCPDAVLAGIGNRFEN